MSCFVRVKFVVTSVVDHHQGQRSIDWELQGLYLTNILLISAHTATVSMLLQVQLAVWHLGIEKSSASSSGANSPRRIPMFTPEFALVRSYRSPTMAATSATFCIWAPWAVAGFGRREYVIVACVTVAVRRLEISRKAVKILRNLLESAPV